MFLGSKQHNAFDNMKKNKAGIRLTLTYEQIKRGIKGRFLSEVLKYSEDKIAFELGKSVIGPLLRQIGTTNKRQVYSMAKTTGG